jgi:putative DNA primase/helicase
VTAGTLFYEAKARGWRDDGTRQKPTAEEIEARRRQSAERAAKQEVEKARERADAREKAAAIWMSATPTCDDHPYLVRKGLSPVPSLREIDAGGAAVLLGYVPKCQDEPLAGRLLVVRVKIGDELSTLELIDQDGRKCAIAGGAKVGGFWAAQQIPEGGGEELTLLIGEGVATVLSAKEAAGFPVVAALYSANLPAVAKTMRARYPATGWPIWSRSQAIQIVMLSRQLGLSAAG